MTVEDHSTQPVRVHPVFSEHMGVIDNFRFVSSPVLSATMKRKQQFTTNGEFPSVARLQAQLLDKLKGH